MAWFVGAVVVAATIDSGLRRNDENSRNDENGCNDGKSRMMERIGRWRVCLHALDSGLRRNDEKKNWNDGTESG